MNIQQHRIHGAYVTDPAVLVDYYSQQKDLPDAGLTPFKTGELFSAQRIGDDAQVLSFVTLRPLRRKGATQALRDLAWQLEAIEDRPPVDDYGYESDPCIHVGRSLIDLAALDKDYSESTVVSKIAANEAEVVKFLARPNMDSFLKDRIGIFLHGPQVQF